MKKLFYLLIFSFVCHFSAAQAQQNDNAREICKKIMRNPEVTILTSYGKLRYDHSKNSRALARMNMRITGGEVDPSRRVNGLATHDILMEIDFKITKNELPDGSACIYPEKVNLKIGAKDPVIYISKDLEAGSCAYNLTLRHEQTHQQINAEVIEYYMPIIRKNFLAAVQKYALISRNVNLVLAKENLMKKYTEAMQPLMAEIEAEIKAEQSKLDSPENYDYEESLCR